MVKATMKQIIDKTRPATNTQFGIDAGETNFPIPMVAKIIFSRSASIFDNVSLCLFVNTLFEFNHLL